MRIKSDFVAYTIVLCLIFALPLFSIAQNVADRKPVDIASAEVTKQTIKNEDPLIKEDDEADAPKKKINFLILIQIVVRNKKIKQAKTTGYDGKNIGFAGDCRQAMGER